MNYLPGDSDSGMFGGNSNWRGPIWMPINLIIVRALLIYYTYFGDSFQVECPAGSGRQMHLYDVAREISRRLIRIFLRDAHGRRPVFANREKFQTDPDWRDYLLFHEYFHGDTGAGIGASHQTGWTSLVATFLSLFGTSTAAEILKEGKRAAIVHMKQSKEVPSESHHRRTKEAGNRALGRSRRA